MGTEGTEKMKKQHSSACFDYAMQNADENWHDANPGVDAYSFSTHDGSFAEWLTEVESWAAEYLLSGTVDCICQEGAEA
jgi:hypothetical protein